MLYIASMWVAGIGQGLMLAQLRRLRQPGLHLHRDRRSSCTPCYVWRALGGAVLRRGRAGHGVQPGR
ncbi:MAG: hypothetical protein MZV65_41395 [Chromatiales bacterium]|nr:hypothetical protein [Chromatiales bacterium]